MHEVIHVSHGPQANYLTSRFFNRQETYFVYKKEDLPKSHVDPSVLFSSGKQYTPRALFWDFRNGFGHLEKFGSVYEHKDTPEGVDTSVSGRELPPGSYWTDDLRVPLHPESLHEIPDWEFDPELFPHGRPRGSTKESGCPEFSRFEMGVEEFKSVAKRDNEEYLDESLRKSMEKCDLLSGIDLNTSLGGWSGFSSVFAETLRDDFAPKLPVFTWLSVSRPTLKYTDDFLESMLALSEFSSVVLPLAEPATDFAAVASIQLPAYETLCLLSSLRKDRVSMFTLAEQMTLQGNANIMSVRDLRIDPFSKLSNPQIRSRVEIVRAGSSEVSDDDELFDIKGYPVEDETITKYICPQASNEQPATYHEIVLDSGPINMRKMVSPRDHSMRERIYELTEPYIWRWQDSDDESD